MSSLRDLRGEGDQLRPFPGEPTREASEDCQVGVQANAVKPANAKREKGPLVLEPAELALDRSTRRVQRAAPLALAWDERMQPVGLDPLRRGCAESVGAPPRQQLVGRGEVLSGNGAVAVCVCVSRREPQSRVRLHNAHESGGYHPFACKLHANEIPQNARNGVGGAA